MLPIRQRAGLFGGFLVILCGFSPAALSAGEMRTWKAAEGNFQVEAALIEQSETHVKLKKKDGTELNVPREKLSKDDLDYLPGADPPLPKFAVKGKPEPTTKPASKSPVGSDSKPSTKTPPSAEKIQSSKSSAAPPKLAGDTFESIQRSFKESFDPLAIPEDQKPVPAARGTDYAALVQELRQPTKVPTFATQVKADVRFVTAAEKAWPQTTCLAEGGGFLVEHDPAGKQLLVWNVETGKQVCAWKCGTAANVRCFAISPSGKYIAIGRDDLSLEVYDVVANKTVRKAKLGPELLSIFRVAFNWPEKSVYLLTESGAQMILSLGNGPDLGGSLLRYLPVQLHSKQKPFQFDVKQDQIEFDVSGDERFGMHLNDKFYLSFGTTNYPRPIMTPTSDAYQPVLPVRYGTVAWISKFVFHKQLQVAPKSFGETRDLAVERAGLVIRKAKRCAVDRDERHVWVYHVIDQERVIEIFDVDYLRQSVRVILPSPPAGAPQDCLWFSAEKQRVVCWSPANKQLTRYDLKDFVEPPSWRLYALVLQAFLEKRYEFLDGFFAELGKLAQPLQGSDGVLPLEEAIAHLADLPMHVHPLNWQRRLENWVTERADSAGPRLLLAERMVKEGWQARGQGSAATVTPEGWEKFRSAGKKAEELLEPLMALEQPPAYAFLLQHNITMMNSRKPEEQVELAKRVCKLYPECNRFHAGMVYNLLPRWFGNQGDSVAYAEKVVELLGGGDTAEIAYAEMGLGLTKMHRPEIYLTATEFDPQRITRGLLKATQRTPDDARAFYKLLQWVYYLRFTDPDSELLDPKLDEQTAKDYAQALNQFDRLVTRRDWTLYGPPEFVELEYAIFEKKLGNPPRPKAK